MTKHLIKITLKRALTKSTEFEAVETPAYNLVTFLLTINIDTQMVYPEAFNHGCLGMPHTCDEYYPVILEQNGQIDFGTGYSSYGHSNIFEKTMRKGEYVEIEDETGSKGTFKITNFEIPNLSLPDSKHVLRKLLEPI